MKIALTGSNGLLGQHLVKKLLDNQYTVVAMSRGIDRTTFCTHKCYNYYEVDIADEKALQNVVMAEKPSVLVHAAAITQVDECELNQEHCHLVNVQGTKNVTKIAKAFCNHLIYISTDFVFDGIEGNYDEEAIAEPISFYGQTKLDSEKLIQQNNIPWAIVRTSLVYGNTISGTRSNIITWVKKELEEGRQINVVSDQVRTPTYVEDLAEGILLIIQKKATGIFHISGKDILTPYDIAIQTADFFNLPKNLIVKVSADTFSQPAKRPPITGLDISKARTQLGYEPLFFLDGLKKMFR
ncbi:MAG: SDR family oxidoreductase [Chitinophagaceae bacterium]